MKEKELIPDEKKDDITRDINPSKPPNNYEVPAFEAIPDAAPLDAIKAGVVSAILPWCC